MFKEFLRRFQDYHLFIKPYNFGQDLFLISRSDFQHSTLLVSVYILVRTDLIFLVTHYKMIRRYIFESSGTVDEGNIGLSLELV